MEEEDTVSIMRLLYRSISLCVSYTRFGLSRQGKAKRMFKNVEYYPFITPFVFPCFWNKMSPHMDTWNAPEREVRSLRDTSECRFVRLYFVRLNVFFLLFFYCKSPTSYIMYNVHIYNRSSDTTSYDIKWINPKEEKNSARNSTL